MRGGSKKRVLPAAADFMRISTTFKQLISKGIWDRLWVWMAPNKARISGLGNAKFVRKTRGQFHQQFTGSFYVPRSQKRKKIQSSYLSFFALLGYAHIKASKKMLVKLTQGVVLLIFFHTF